MLGKLPSQSQLLHRVLLVVIALLIVGIIPVFVHFHYIILPIFSTHKCQDRRLSLTPQGTENILSPTTNRLGVLPKIIHQSWSTRELPSKFDAWSRSCREQNPDWKWVLWTDEDNLNLVKQYCPWLLEYYLQLPSEIYRADLVRNLYMYIYGGIYVDLDTECLRPVDELFKSYNVSTISYNASYEVASKDNSGKKRTAFFGRMGTDDDFDHSIPNAWMASTPGHPFFLLPLESVIDRLSRNDANTVPEALTGPVALKEAINMYGNQYAHPGDLEVHLQSSILNGMLYSQYKMKHSIEILPYWMVFPYSWGQDGNAYRSACSIGSQEYDREKCKQLVTADHKDSFFLTCWSHTWSWEGHDPNSMKNVESKLL
ncbi:nucleotide-diphospho-sugar transferase [Lipomyces starkeyi]